MPFFTLSLMKSTIATLLCLGMVVATPNQNQGQCQPFPAVPKNSPQLPQVLQQLNLQSLDCIAGQCPPAFFHGVWRANLPDPKMHQEIGCTYLGYGIHVDLSESARKPSKVTNIYEGCNGEHVHLTYPKDDITGFIHGGFGVKIFQQPNYCVRFQFEKMFIYKEKVLAAVVQHPILRNSRGKLFQSARSLWLHTGEQKRLETLFGEHLKPYQIQLLAQSI